MITRGGCKRVGRKQESRPSLSLSLSLYVKNRANLALLERKESGGPSMDHPIDRCYVAGCIGGQFLSDLIGNGKATTIRDFHELT